ncbi:MAG: hypothetical protein KJ674_04775 [Nanoarchaeota archaeon]|nr:hypothetical protein [Nanoarchaeota archaeon]
MELTNTGEGTAVDMIVFYYKLSKVFEQLNASGGLEDIKLKNISFPESTIISCLNNAGKGEISYLLKNNILVSEKHLKGCYFRLTEYGEQLGLMDPHHP